MMILGMSTRNDDVEFEANPSDLVHKIVHAAFQLDTTEQTLQAILFGGDEIGSEATFADHDIEV